MKMGSEVLDFVYGADGTPMAVVYNGTYYYYVTNLQGDVTAILNSSGTVVVSYTYDAWGNILTTTGSLASTIGTLNPLRYRGYVYGTETGFYYLQSRYYDPIIGRFLNADAFASTGQGLLGNNMFAYCNNNPANALDVGGYIPQGLANPNAMLHDDVFVYYGIPDYVREAETEAQRMRRGRSLFNTDEQAVIDAKGYAFYKGQLVIKQNWAITDGCSFSFLIMFLHEKETDSSAVKHEYGHFLQLKKYGLLKYTTSIAVPSVIFNRIDSAGLLPWNYYNSPWEYEADQFGRVTRKEHTKLAKILSFIYSMQISGVRSGIYQW